MSRYNESYNWFELHRSRDQKIFEGKKIVCGYRTEEPCFAYHEGSFYGSTDMYFIKPINPQDKHSLKYLLAILNSKTINFWLSKKGKPKGNITEQFTTPIENLYVPRIDFNNPEKVKSHDNLVELVDKIIDAKRELSKFNTFFPTIQLTHLSENSPLPEINPESIVQALSPEKRFSLRTCSNIKIAYSRDFEGAKFILNKIGKTELTLEGPELMLISKTPNAIFLKGQVELLQIISMILENHKNKSWVTIKELPLIPETTIDYESKKQEVIGKVVNLRSKIQKLKTSIDPIVFKLYGVSENFQLVIKEH